VQDLQRQLSNMKTRQRHTHIAEVYEPGAENMEEADVVEVCLADFGAPKHTHEWYIDLGTTKHVTRSSSALRDFVPSSHHSTIRTAGRTNLPIVGKANVRLTIQSGEIKELSNVLYMPGVKKNLLSIGQLADQGHIVLFNAKQCYVLDKDTRRSFLTASRDPRNRLYRVHGSSSQADRTNPDKYLINSVAKTSQIEHVELWHKRIGHINLQSLYHLSISGIVTGMPKLPLVKYPCSSCIQGKHHRDSFPRKRSSVTVKPLELVH
jgi:hypothetical protein